MTMKSAAVLALALCSTIATAQSVSYSKKNGSVEIISTSDKLAFSIASVVGQNRCELEGTAERIDADRFGYTSDDMADKCVALLNTRGGKLTVTTKGCESQCGSNAAGSMDGTYTKAK